MEAADKTAEGAKGKSVLVIAYHFTPDSAIGARRTERLVRYLPSCGWISHVLTVKPCYYQHTDNAPPAHDTEVASITRTLMIRNPRYIYLKAKQLLPLRFRQFLKSRRTKTVDENQAPGECKSGWRRLLLSLLLLPDEKQGWLPFAVFSGLMTVAGEHVDCIYSSGPPWTTHLSALILSKLTRLPWVADFRDPWSTTTGKPPYSTSRVSERIESAFQEWTYRTAAAIIVNTPQATDELLKTHPEIEGKLFAITNGFDSNELARVEGSLKKPYPPFAFTHAGTLFPGRDPGPFLHAFESLIADGSIPPDMIRLNFLGVTELDSSEVVSLMGRLAHQGYLVETGLLPRFECLRKLRESHALMLFDMATPMQVAAKLYDYLLAGRPILDMTYPGSPSSEIVSRTRTGIVVDWSDHESLRSGILQMLDLLKHEDTAFSPDFDQILKFDSSSLTCEFAHVLDFAVVNSSRGRRV